MYETNRFLERDHTCHKSSHEEANRPEQDEHRWPCSSNEASPMCIHPHFKTACLPIDDSDVEAKIRRCAISNARPQTHDTGYLYFKPNNIYLRQTTSNLCTQISINSITKRLFQSLDDSSQPGCSASLCSRHSPGTLLVLFGTILRCHSDYTQLAAAVSPVR